MPRAGIRVRRTFEVVPDVIDGFLQQIQALGHGPQPGEGHLRDGRHQRLRIRHRLLEVPALILLRQVLLHLLVKAVQALAQVLAQLLEIFAGVTAVRPRTRVRRVHDDGLGLDQTVLCGHLQALGDEFVHQFWILKTLTAETRQAARVDHHRLLRRQAQEAFVLQIVAGLLHDIHIRPVVDHLYQKVFEQHARIDSHPAVVRAVLGPQFVVDEIKAIAQFIKLTEPVVLRDNQIIQIRVRA